MNGMAAASDVFPLEEFQILGPIGKGEFGKVHRATWVGHDVDVALKHVEASQGASKLQAEQDGVRLQELVWQPSSALLRLALVRMWARSLPACGSVMPIAVTSSPVTNFGSQRSCCLGVVWSVR